MTGRRFTCTVDVIPVFLSFLGEGIRTHVDMHLSLCLLVIDVIDFLITLESNINHNMKDVLYEVRCLKSNEDMILAHTGQFIINHNQSDFL